MLKSIESIGIDFKDNNDLTIDADQSAILETNKLNWIAFISKYHLYI